MWIYLDLCGFISTDVDLNGFIYNYLDLRCAIVFTYNKTDAHVALHTNTVSFCCVKKTAHKTYQSTRTDFDRIHAETSPP